MMFDSPMHIDQIGAPLSPEGRRIMCSFFDKRQSVIISANAGTGKTTLLTNTIVETVIREVEKKGNYKVLDQIIAVTFTVEAARQMKEKVRKGLEKYFHGRESPEIMRLLQSLESESWISTIDALTARLVSLVCLDMQVPPGTEISEPHQIREMQQKVIEELRKNLHDQIESLEQAFPEDWESILSEGMHLMAMYLIGSKAFVKRMRESFALFYKHLESDKD